MTQPTAAQDLVASIGVALEALKQIQEEIPIVQSRHQTGQEPLAPEQQLAVRLLSVQVKHLIETVDRLETDLPR